MKTGVYWFGIEENTAETRKPLGISQHVWDAILCTRKNMWETVWREEKTGIIHGAYELPCMSLSTHEELGYWMEYDLDSEPWQQWLKFRGQALQAWSKTRGFFKTKGEDDAEDF